MTLMDAALRGLRTAALLTAPAVIALAPLARADAGAVSVTRAEDVDMSTERLDAIGVGMRQLIDEKKIPGTVTLVARRGKVVHFEANGLRDVDAKLPMRKDTIFPALFPEQTRHRRRGHDSLRGGALSAQRSHIEISA